MVTARPAPNAAPVGLRVRKDIETAQRPGIYRPAQSNQQAITLNDKRGYEYSAGWHVVPWEMLLPAFTAPAPGLAGLAGDRAYLGWLELPLWSELLGVTLP
jgi:hypothetical protein